MRLNVKQLPDGRWAAFSGKASYWVDTVRDTEKEAKVAALHRKGQDAQAIIDRVDAELRKLGAFNENDPHAYLA